MTDLLQALTKGPGSRELSDRVLLSWGWGYRNGGWSDPHGEFVCHQDAYALRPDPTRNLQHAVDGVPEGWFWTVGFENVGDAEHYIGLVAYVWKPKMTEHLESSRASTPALALCIAIEKALSTSYTLHGFGGIKRMDKPAEIIDLDAVHIAGLNEGALIEILSDEQAAAIRRCYLPAILDALHEAGYAIANLETHAINLRVMEHNVKHHKARVEAEAENARLREAQANMIAMWDILPEGNHSRSVVVNWLEKNMAPAIERLRAALKNTTNG